MVRRKVSTVEINASKKRFADSHNMTFSIAINKLLLYKSIPTGNSGRLEDLGILPSDFKTRAVTL